MNYVQILSISFFLTFSTFGSLALSSTLSPTTVTIEQSVHFVTPDGKDLVVEPGTYEVAAREQALALTQEGKDSLLIQAQEPPVIEEDLSFPVAMAIPVEKEGIYLALEVPNQQGLEAMGSYSGIQTRGFSLRKLRKPFKPPYKKRLKSFAQKLRKPSKGSSLKQEWNDLLKQRKSKAKSSPGKKGRTLRSWSTSAITLEVLRQAYLENQRDLKQYRDKIKHTNKKKLQIRKKIQETRRDQANAHAQGKKNKVNKLSQMKQRLEQELKKLGDTSEQLNFKLQKAMQQYSKAQQAMAQLSKKMHDTKMNIIENLK